ncbi:MAG: hypothetical protein SGILL_009260, partial [Bacillariaceae sp.]
DTGQIYPVCVENKKVCGFIDENDRDNEINEVTAYRPDEEVEGDLYIIAPEFTPGGDGYAGIAARKMCKEKGYELMFVKISLSFDESIENSVSDTSMLGLSELAVHFHDNDLKNFQTTEDLMLFFEGLAWK